MRTWYSPAFAALIIFGFWGFFPKLAVRYISPQSAAIYQVGGALLVGLAMLAQNGFRPETHPLGILFAILTGVTGIVGTLCYLAAAKRGPITVIVCLTALYPIVTILLAAFFLHEPITGRQILGLLLALIAILLLVG